jgi:1-acyl-sn-glycerol-3-phosphate acyltransferase
MFWPFISAVILLLLFLLIYLLPRFIRACEAASPADWGSRGITRIAGFVRLYCQYFHRVQFDPLALPEDGPALVVSNHISGLDPFLMIAISPRPLRFLIAREQYERFGLNWLFKLAKCIPVDRKGRPERALREAMAALEQGDVVALFPHGRIHLDTDPPRKLKAGVAFLAKKSNCAVFPVRVDGVRAAGYTFLSLLIPSRRARLKTCPVLDCGGVDQEECLKTLAACIETTSIETTSGR